MDRFHSPSAFFFYGLFVFLLQIGDPHMGATIATAMFAIILLGVCFGPFIPSSLEQTCLRFLIVITWCEVDQISIR